jgi:choline kinase
MELQGAIIAAGRGERLRAGGVELPKPLVELDGMPLLSRQASQMIAAGAEIVHAVVNRETARLIETRAIALPPELHLIERDTASSMESLFTLGEVLRPGRFVLATVDAILTPADFAAFVSEALRATDSGANPRFDGALGVVRWRGDRRPLFVISDNDGRIRELGDRESQWVTAGVYLLSTEIFGLIWSARSMGLGAMREFLAMLITNGVRLGAIPVAHAIDIDEAADLDAARVLIQSQASRP